MEARNIVIIAVLVVVLLAVLRSANFGLFGI
jgi:hypothetical protein